LARLGEDRENYLAIFIGQTGYRLDWFLLLVLTKATPRTDRRIFWNVPAEASFMSGYSTSGIPRGKRVQ